MPDKKRQSNFITFLLIVFIAAIVILVVVLLGGREKPAPVPSAPVDQQVEQLKTLSTSDEVSEIDKDLQDTSLNQIDAELKEVENNLQDL